MSTCQRQYVNEGERNLKEFCKINADWTLAIFLSNPENAFLHHFGSGSLFDGKQVISSSRFLELIIFSTILLSMNFTHGLAQR